ncbi:MAG: SpoIIE family protein phosphatase [Thermoleophilaceae bacterium]
MVARLGQGRNWLLLALGVITAIAAVDAATEGSAVLIGLLVAGPLVAAGGASPRATAVVALYALGLALFLGVADDFFGSANHLSRVLVVAVGGSLTVVISYLRERRERDSTRLRVQYGVARVLADAEALDPAAPRLLEAIGGPLGFEVGGLWESRGSGALRCVETWSAPGVQVPHFAEASRQLELRPGIGVPGRVFEQAMPLWIPDVLAEQNFPRGAVAAEEGLRAAIAFPVVAAGVVVGVIEFFDPDVLEPDADMLDLMAALGAQIGEFVESHRAQEALRASEGRKSAILEAALDCVITIDRDGTVVEMNPAAERTFGYREAEAVGREMAELVIPPEFRDRHREALRRLAEGGEPRILGQRLELTGMRSDGATFPVELAITRIAGHDPPMYTGYVRDITDRLHGERERERILGLEQAARVGAVHAREQLEAILGGVADGVTAQAPDGRVIFANEAATRTLGYGSTEEILEAQLEEILGRFELFDEEGRPFPLERLPGRRALKGEEAPEALARFRSKATGEERWSVVKATPVRDEHGAVAMAINVFEDITEHKRAELQERFLSESSRLLAATLDPDQTLQQVAWLAVPEVADWCAVDLRTDDGGIERVALAHADPEQLKRAEEFQENYPPQPDDPTGVGHVMRAGEPELYQEVPDELLRDAAVDDQHLEMLRAFGFRSAMVVPMLSRGETIGALTFVSGPSGRRFDEHDLVLVEELARRCATAIENARLYSERAYIARTLQESLLPAELPHIPGLDTAARFRAAGEGTEVGGDFYDLFQTGRRGWTVVVGDVCGKGPDAAAVTALARYTLRAAAMRERLPSRSLRILNEALLRQRTDRRFCTVAYAYLERANGSTRIGFASGGHPLPLLLRQDGEVSSFGVFGTLLGVVPDPSLEDCADELTAGDALVFYTDGVTEARGEGGMLGEEQLAEVVASCAGLKADAIAARVEEAALGAQDGSPTDDIAVVVLRVSGSAV